MIKNKILVLESIGTWLDVDTGMMGPMCKNGEMETDEGMLNHITEVDVDEIHHNISSYEKPMFDFFLSYLPSIK